MLLRDSIYLLQRNGLSVVDENRYSLSYLYLMVAESHSHNL